MVIVLRIIILIVIILISLSVYKLISWQLKKQLLEAERISKESKTEEERTNALRELKRKNIVKSIISYFVFILGLSILFITASIFIRKISFIKIKPIGSYELCERNGISYYGKHEYSIFCDNNGDPAFSIYKIFNKINKTKIETNSYEEFIGKLEELFMTKEIDKINFYGTCSADLGYKSLGYALNNSHLIEYHAKEDLEDRQIIHVKTINGILIEIEYLHDDMICTCSGA